MLASLEIAVRLAEQCSVVGCREKTIEMASHQNCIKVLKSLEETILQASDIPQGDALNFISITQPVVKQDLQTYSKQLVSAIRSISSRYSIIKRFDRENSQTSSSSESSGSCQQDSIFDEVTEIVDEAMEKFNVALDKARGIQDATVASNTPIAPGDAIQIGVRIPSRKLGGFLDIEKPQIHFHDYPVDNSDTPFVSIYDVNKQVVKSKDSAGEQMQSYLQDLFKKNSQTNVNGRHPYQEEIIATAEEMSKISFEEKDTIVYKSFDDTPCTFVDTEEELFNVVQRIAIAKEIAIDLENHSIRSFQGFTCLMQISTRKEDFVIDTLALRSCIHRAFAPIFADETTIKVMHGADRDVQWLERDFGIYVVNMFDTGQAARVLKFPSFSLAYLLLRHCNVKAIGKQKFQLADWRVRPLPKDMFEYARSDTHYLLYIFDRLRTELCKKEGLLKEAWMRAAKICRKRHTRIRYDANMGKYLAAKHALGFDAHQVRMLEELCRWRDRVAREEDESLIYVTPLNVLYGIVRARENAKSVEGLFKFGFPTRIIPPIVHKYAEEIVKIVTDSLDAKLDEKKQLSEDEKILTVPSKSLNEKDQKEDVEEEHISDSDDSEFETNANQEEETHEAVVLKKPKLPDVPIPQIKEAQSKKSDFFDSESDSDDEDVDNETADAVMNEADSREVSSIQNMAEESEKHRRSFVTTYEKENVTTSDPVIQKTEEDDVKEQQDSQTSKLAATKSSVFDLSDGSDSEDEFGMANDAQKHEQHNKLAAIGAEIDAKLADTKGDASQHGFLVESDKVESEEHVEEKKGTKRSAEESDNAEESQVLSILEAAKLRGVSINSNGAETKRKKRRRNKTKGDKVTEKDMQVPKVEPFDYGKALKQQKKNMGKVATDFDPMEKLKADWKGAPGANSSTNQSNRRVRKRRKGKAKSMSFKAK